MQDFGNFLSSIGTGATDFASSVGTGIGDAANSASSAIGQGVTGLADSVGSAAPSISGPLASGASALPTGGLTGAIGDAVIPGGTGSDPLLSGGDPLAAPGSTLASNTPTVPTSFLDPANPAGAMAPSPGSNTIPGLPSSVQSPSWFHQMFGGGGAPAAGGGANWAKLAIPAALLGGSIYEGTRPAPGLANLQKLAGSEGGIAAQLGPQVLGELTTGTLPQPAQAALDQALRDAHSSIKSKYASMGMSGSTAEAQDLQAADQNALAQRFRIAQELAQTGLSGLNAATGQEAALYQAILGAQTAQDTALGQALAGFAGALVH